MKPLGNVTLGLVISVAQRWHHRPRFLPSFCSAIVIMSAWLPLWLLRVHLLGHLPQTSLPLQNGFHGPQCNFEIWQCPAEEETVSMYLSFRRRNPFHNVPRGASTMSPWPESFILLCLTLNPWQEEWHCWDWQRQIRIYPGLEIHHFPWGEQNHQVQSFVIKEEGGERMWAVKQ